MAAYEHQCHYTAATRCPHGLEPKQCSECEGLLFSATEIWALGMPVDLRPPGQPGYHGEVWPNVTPTHEAGTELRPPPEHDHVRLHWIRQEVSPTAGPVPDKPPTIALWAGSFNWGWYLIGSQRQIGAGEMWEIGYRYLRPAEWKTGDWRDNEEFKVLAQAWYSLDFERTKAVAFHLRERDDARARIAQLEAENAQLRADIRKLITRFP